MAKTIEVDEYVFTVLMRDLVGHDRALSAYLVYLHLWCETERQHGGAIRTSHQTMAETTGLSKSAVQKGVRLLLRRKLLRTHRESATATPEYRVQRTWR